MYYNFEEDLKHAKQVEKGIALLLKERTENFSSYTLNDDNSYDIKVIFKNGKSVKFEVKCDILAEKTSNVAIEVSCRGKPSGLSVTQADYWIHILKVDIKAKVIPWLFNIQTLQKLISLPECRTVTGGDRNSMTICKLIPVKIFVKHGVNLLNLPVYKFNKGL